jgi:hypothetical protein
MTRALNSPRLAGPGRAGPGRAAAMGDSARSGCGRSLRRDPEFAGRALHPSPGHPFRVTVLWPARPSPAARTTAGGAVRRACAAAAAATP